MVKKMNSDFIILWGIYATSRNYNSNVESWKCEMKVEFTHRVGRRKYLDFIQNRQLP